MRTEQGNIPLGTIDQLFCQHQFRTAVGEATRVVIPTVPAAVWDQRLQAIIKVCEEGDERLARETRRLVKDYLLENPPQVKEWEKAALAKIPLVKDGVTHLFIKDFQRWLKLSANLQIGEREIANRFRPIGINSNPLNVYVESDQTKRTTKDRTTRSAWMVPADCLPKPESTEPSG